MDEIYMNTHSVKTACQIPVRKNEGPGSSKKKIYVGVIIFLVLLNVLMLIGLISLGLYYHNAGDIASSNLTECQQDGNNNISILIEERDLLNANLTAVTQELMKLRESTCPTGWITSSVSCYYFSNEAGSWDEGRRDCIDRGADLLVMNNAEEKTFLAALIKNEAWIGLNDKETEGSWKWVDGNSPEFKNWYNSQPDNGGTSGRWGEEDCVLVNNYGKATWNDFSCDGAKHWICEKVLKLSV
ncbi:C-type lectin domain family 17, member A-like [Gambusia affinis]|uniref:C-type lectin domain family 17, member A-like n=1 Tax=Gambusia affinis TaxID=33528 RepID=UPI001CDBDC8D|nr:C-type lectin domain family 17, member A-like [Gambusia affinis]XP_043988839.1 C-type lectin domain family 17, member A-like [Gambusia affinis]